MKKTNIILDQDQINKIVKRIAYQIHETNNKESHVFLIGIHKNGFLLAQLINEELKLISNSIIELCSIKINKKDPKNNSHCDIDLSKMKNKSVVLIDDVLNSGKTLIYAVKYILDVPLSKFNTSVLIDRNHKKFPIKIDFKGISLSTSIEENVNVVFENNKSYAFID